MKTQNIVNSIEDLKNATNERYPIPKEWAEQTSFFHRSERINFLIIAALEKVGKKIEDLERDINARD